jgi:hypothetical protein
MKKVFFSIMAITMLSTAGFATKHKSVKKKQASKCECPAGCPKTPACHKACS